MNELPKNQVDGRTRLLTGRLESQYKIFREDNRSYVRYAAASTTLLTLLLVGELTAVRSDPRFYVLMLISVLWYGAIMSLFISHSSVMAEYSELLELKLNYLLRSEIFEFENRYAFPRTGKSVENAAYGGFSLTAGLIPITVGFGAGWYGLTKGFHLGNCIALWILAFCFVVLAIESIAVLYIRKLRGKDNQRRIAEWKREVELVPESENQPSSQV